VTSAGRSRSATAGSGWFTSKRYGSPAAVVGSVVAFGLLFCFFGYTIVMSAYLMSNDCIGDTGQLPICPANGPDWARPLPPGAALLGLLAGLAGLLAGRPVRTPALIAGFLLTAAGLAGSELMEPT
jgi:hypothetical protein